MYPTEAEQYYCCLPFFSSPFRKKWEAVVAVGIVIAAKPSYALMRLGFSGELSYLVKLESTFHSAILE